MIRPLSRPSTALSAAARSKLGIAALVASLAAACIPSPADAPNAAQAPASGPANMSPGTHVQVAKQGQWYGATILQPLGEGRFLVHYDNTGNEWNDEAVGPDRIKPFTMGTLEGARASGPRSLRSPNPFQPARDYHPGERVLVTYQSRLLVGDIVMQVAPDTFRVHYDAFGPEAIESVTADRIRRPFSGATPHAVGDALTVDVNGQAMPAKVVAASAADHWVVRFDNYGPQYDQEIGADRIKTTAAAPSAASAPPPVLPSVTPPVAEAAAAKDEKAKPKGPPPDGAPLPQTGPPAVGETVFVSLRGAWLPASVTAATAAGVKVKFASGGEEEVPADRVLREPATTKGLHYQPGQLVLVEYKGGLVEFIGVWLPAKVLKLVGKDYKVRFEDWLGPENDEIVLSKRLRPR
jgi:hypothetical protein